MSEVVGIDLGGTNIRAGRVDASGRLLARVSVPTEVGRGAKVVMQNIVTAARKVFSKAVKAACVVSPGVINPRTGTAESIACNIPGWLGMPLAENLSSALGIPGFAENDANAACLAEAWCGAGRGKPSVLIFTLGTGIGGGIVMNGGIYHGTSNKVAEFGHISVELNGPECPCGNRGCVEMYASAGAVRKKARSMLEQGAHSAMLELAGGLVERVDAGEVCEAARRGDAVASGILDEAMQYLASAVGSMINALNPSCVLIGGGMALSWDVISPRLLAGLAGGRAFAPIYADCEVKPAELGDNAGLLGAAKVALQGLGKSLSEPPGQEP